VSADPHRVFVLCPSYHGATLLALLLSEHHDIVDLGDTNPEMRRDLPCGCGLTVATCEFWQRLRSELSPPLVTGDRYWFPKTLPFTNHARANVVLGYVCAIGNMATRGRASVLSPAVERYRLAQQVMARVATEATGSHVFVDGEKSVEKALFLRSASDRPVRFIHLTRDPRGYALSASTRLAGTEPGRPASPDFAGLAAVWRRYHRKARFAGRLAGRSNTLLVRYEDLATETEATMARIFDFIGVPPLGPTALRTRTRPTHAIGNKLLRTYDGSISLDERWRSELTASQAEAILRESGRFAAELGYR
jgi:hypothetical protein